jgi:hypothetical protein
MVNKIKDKKIGEIINIKNIDIPVKIDDIPKFEKQNDINIDVYIFIKKNKDESMFYERIYKSVGTYKDSMKLLLIEYQKQDIIGNELTANHYIYINKFENMYNINKRHNGNYKICDICCRVVWIHKDLKTNNNSFENHREICNIINLNDKNREAIKIFPTEKDKWSVNKFKKYGNMLPMFNLYTADFESILKNATKENSANTQYLQEHKAFAYGITAYESLRENNKYTTIVDENEDEDKLLITFIERMLVNYNNCYSVIEKAKEPLNLSQEEERLFQESTKCYICNELLKNNKNEVDKVRDHCHITGKYRGAAHNSCNLTLKYKMCHASGCIKKYDDKFHICKKFTITCVLHNLTGYDSKYIMKGIYKYCEKHKLDMNDRDICSVIAKSKEKISAIYFRGINFIDSCSFVMGTLDKLTAKLKDKEATKSIYTNIIKERGITEKELSFTDINKKLLFPYGYITSYSKLLEKDLPEK